ncbi:MAG: Transposase [Ignavibacteria bacterium]|nr:Transposase [Ignavibacteria bacterium]
MMTIQDVSETVGVGWDMVKGIQKQYLEKHYGSPDLKKVRSIAIDEIAIEKGHKYLTVVMDLETGAIVFVGDGKHAESLQPFWKRLKRSGAKIESVAIDMSPAYIEAVTKNLQSSKIVFDHFHIIKMYNETLSELRRDLYNFETDAGKKNY